MQQTKVAAEPFSTTNYRRSAKMNTQLQRSMQSICDISSQLQFLGSQTSGIAGMASSVHQKVSARWPCSQALGLVLLLETRLTCHDNLEPSWESSSACLLKLIELRISICLPSALASKVMQFKRFSSQTLQGRILYTRLTLFTVVYSVHTIEPCGSSCSGFGAHQFIVSQFRCIYGLCSIQSS